MRQTYIALLALGLSVLLPLSSCSLGSKSSFVAEGKVLGAEGQVLYLEEVGTGSVLSLDSARLDKEGEFRFEREGTPYPMFYRLRLGEASIPFVADSVTHIVIDSKGVDFFRSYTLAEADSYNHQIRQIALMRDATDRSIDSLISGFQSGTIAREDAARIVDSVVQDFKRCLTTRYIYVEPKSPAAYFALFQYKGNGAYFSVDDPGDERAFAAVATAYDTFYPEAPYVAFLKDMALEAVARGKARRQISTANSLLNGELVNFPEVKLSDSRGGVHSLTAMAKEGPVLLSFTSYQGEWSPQLVASLKSVLAKRKGLKVYEVSLDSDTYYWRNAVRTLPWTCVQDIEGKTANSYNVQTLPSIFLIEDGNIRRLDRPEEVLH